MLVMIHDGIYTFAGWTRRRLSPLAARGGAVVLLFQRLLLELFGIGYDAIDKAPVFLLACFRRIRQLLTADNEHSILILIPRMENHVQPLNFFGAFRLVRFDARSIKEIDVPLFENTHRRFRRLAPAGPLRCL